MLCQKCLSELANRTFRCRKCGELQLWNYPTAAGILYTALICGMLTPFVISCRSFSFYQVAAMWVAALVALVRTWIVVFQYRRLNSPKLVAKRPRDGGDSPI
jgi:hypothetical protein